MTTWNHDVEKGGATVEAQGGADPRPTSEPTPPISPTNTTLTTTSYSTTKPLVSQSTRSSRLTSCFSKRKLPKLPSSWTSPSLLRREPKQKKKVTTRTRKLHEQARGYQKLATFLDCDENFMIYRRFGYLQSRLLLEKQDDLVRLERKLDYLEGEEFEEDETSLMSRRHLHDDSLSEKAKLLKEIEAKWIEYCTLVEHASKMVSLNKPTTVEHSSVTNFIDNTKPVLAPEGHFIKHKEDLIILRPGREYAWLDSKVEGVLRWPQASRLRCLFQSEETQAKSDGSDGTVLCTRSRIENCVIFILTLMILAMLVIPIYVLYHLTLVGSAKSSMECICVLLVATLIFSACTSLFTRAKRYEILAAAAAYCAVLVVFFGNIDNHGNNIPAG